MKTLKSVQETKKEYKLKFYDDGINITDKDDFLLLSLPYDDERFIVSSDLDINTLKEDVAKSLELISQVEVEE